MPRLAYGATHIGLVVLIPRTSSHIVLPFIDHDIDDPPATNDGVKVKVSGALALLVALLVPAITPAVFVTPTKLTVGVIVGMPEPPVPQPVKIPPASCAHRPIAVFTEFSSATVAEALVLEM